MGSKVLVTGALGATGKHAIERLLEWNVPVRAMVRTIDERCESLSAKGVEVVQGDLSEFSDVSAALKGIETAYFMYPVIVPGLLQATAYFAQAALEENVSLIVNMSQRTARRDSMSHGAQNHWLAERLLDRSGVPVVHLQPTLFDEWLEYFAKDLKANNRIISPYADAAYAHIAAEDIGHVIAEILVRPAGHAGQTYPLYGPEELTEYQVADILTEILGRKITYVPMEIEEYKVLLTKYFSPYFVQHIGGIALDFRSGVVGGLNDMVEKISGTKPLHLADYVKKNITLFK